MQLVFKAGNKFDPLSKTFTAGWRDGQLVDIRPSGFYTGKRTRLGFVVIDIPDNPMLSSIYTKDARVSDFYDVKKFITPTDSIGKYPWEFGYLIDEKRTRPRDWRCDFKSLLDQKLIAKAQFEQIYDKSKPHDPVYIDQDFTTWVKHEDAVERLVSDYSLQRASIASGTYSIGSGLDYDTVTLFEADIAAQLTGNLTGEHANEETSITTDVIFDTDTNGSLLKLTAASGAEHNGAAYGNGARIAYGTFDSITFDETNDGDLVDIEVSKLALDITGSDNDGIRVVDVSSTANVLIERMLIAGSNVTDFGIEFNPNAIPNTAMIRNNIVYGISTDRGLSIARAAAGGGTYSVLNNTVIGCSTNIYFVPAGSSTATLKNNLCQNGGTDYNIASIDVNAKNISEDATSPDASYQSKDVHTNSVFQDYANDNYKLDPAGDATNLAIVDDGDNLYGSGVTEDIIGQARVDGTPFYIGASTIVSGETILIGNGSLALTGQDVFIPEYINVPKGSLSIVGQDVTVLEPIIEIIGKGALSLLGRSVTIAGEVIDSISKIVKNIVSNIVTPIVRR